MNGGTVRRGDGRLIAGAILIGLGVIYTLDSFGVLYDQHLHSLGRRGPQGP
jgi:hypothetical protein